MPALLEMRSTGRHWRRPDRRSAGDAPAFPSGSGSRRRCPCRPCVIFRISMGSWFTGRSERGLNSSVPKAPRFRPGREDWDRRMLAPPTETSRTTPSTILSPMRNSQGRSTRTRWRLAPGRPLRDHPERAARDDQVEDVPGRRSRGSRRPCRAPRRSRTTVTTTPASRIAEDDEERAARARRCWLWRRGPRSWPSP